MTTRVELDRQLDRLECMLPPWLEKLHHREQFWPQFQVLTGEIIGQCDPADLPHARFRVARMILQNEPQLDRWR